ncbi:hypothetical protein [Streptomyces sp.]|uniref:hypothetical protein n=1 Tax=Streptomyces sp. TaxID=1931 RepID=UPI002F42F5B7
MRVRMKIQISGTRDGQDGPAPGGVIDLPDAEAGFMIGSGAAEDAATEPADSGTAEDMADPDLVPASALAGV